MVVESIFTFFKKTLWPQGSSFPKAEGSRYFHRKDQPMPDPPTETAGLCAQPFFDLFTHNYPRNRGLHQSPGHPGAVPDGKEARYFRFQIGAEVEPGRVELQTP